MRIRDAIDTNPPTLSFEFFPPKDEIGFWDLYRTIESLRPLNPTYVSVTYGAGGATRRKTIELVVRIKTDIGIESMAHLTCVGSPRQELAGILDELKQRDVVNVLALRGDPPEGQREFTRTEGGFAHANELVAFIRDRHQDSFCLGAACYPEGHPECNDPQTDLDNLKRKVDAGVDFLISQLFFNNDDFLAFRDRAAAAGIDVPIIAGLMPVLSARQVRRFTEMCGAAIPPTLLEQIEAVEDDPEAVRQVGMYHTTQQCHGLIDEGVAGIHFYTLNRSTATRAMFQQLKPRLVRQPQARS
ncbi:MAG TPA: methylenetetrahydrofolate reductase [NAD(P)H] [Phycisphaerae bacterium]|nr:methylenetetrahydrofolate reductase [NAD(P)H] [Phycisphaerae bacterium]